MKQLHLLLLAAALTLAGLGVATYKVAAFGYPLTPAARVETWIVEARLGFEPGGGAVRADLAIPDNPPGFVLLDENFISRGWGLTTRKEGANRIAEWSARRPGGRQALYYRAKVHRGAVGTNDIAAPSPPPVPDYEEPFRSAALAVLDEVRARSADVTTFATQLITVLNTRAHNENVKLIIPPGASDSVLVERAVRLLAGARIAARSVHGVRLSEWSREATLVAWLEVHNGKEWVAINPADATPGYPPDFFVWWRGGRPPYEISNARDPDLRFSVAHGFEEALEVAVQRTRPGESRLYDFSLLSLPVQTQNIYRILLLVPVGTLIIVFFRNVIGVQTFGTFMPVLIALAFEETRLLGGMILFTLLMAMGLAVRFYLERLQLLVVPRLAAVVTVVILLMASLSVISHQLDIELGLSVALFPMVILAMTIERMTIVWEERGPGSAITQGLGSLAVAAAAYVVMFQPQVQHSVFVFPELVLVILALTLLLGRYTGYRLSELLRFSAFRAP
jgi:hypothetical protein